MNREKGDILGFVAVIIGIILVVYLVGSFGSSRTFWDSFNFKEILRLPCGLTVEHPDLSKGEKIAYPLIVDGYVNGCGWNDVNGSAGTAQIFDGQGTAVTAPKTLLIPPSSTNAPYYFSTELVPIAAPHTDTGYILITSSTGLLDSISVNF